MKKAGKITLIVALVLIVTLSLPLLLVRIALSNKVSNQLLALVPNYVNADAHIANIDYSIVSTWPDISVQLDSVLVRSRVCTPADTLLYLDQLTLNVNARAFLRQNKIEINECQLQHPVIKISCCDSTFSWAVMPPDTTAKDTSNAQIPAIYWQQIGIQNARIVFNDSCHTQFALLNGLSLNLPAGSFVQGVIDASLQLGFDSARYADPFNQRYYNIGAFNLLANAQYGQQIGNHIHVEADAPALSGTDSLFNLHNRSLSLLLEATTDTAFTQFTLNPCSLVVDNTSIWLQGNLGLLPNQAYSTQLSAKVHTASIKRLLELVPNPYLKQLHKLAIDGEVLVEARSQGIYQGKNLPNLSAHLEISKLKAGFKGHQGQLDCLNLNTDAAYFPKHKDSTFVKLHQLKVNSKALSLDTQGEAIYKNGKPYIDVKLLSDINLLEINKIYQIEPNAQMQGDLHADINTYFYLDDLKEKNIYQLFSKSTLSGDGIRCQLPKTGLDADIDSLRFRLNTNTETKSRRRTAKAKTDTSLVNTRLTFKTMQVTYKDQLKAMAKRFSLSLLADDIEKGKTPRARISVSTSGLQAEIGDSLHLKAKRASASVSMSKDTLHSFRPNTVVSLRFDSILTAMPGMGALLDSTRIRFEVSPRFRSRRRVVVDGQKQWVVLPDSMQKVVDVPALLTLVDTIRKSSDPMEMYLKKFSNEGKIYVRKLGVRQMGMPLRTSVRKLDIQFSDDTIRLNNLRVNVGRSAVSFSGYMYNLRRYLLRGKTLTADLSLSSRRINLNQILGAIYLKNQADTLSNQSQTAGNMALVEQGESTEIVDETTDTETPVDSTLTLGLPVIPGNLDLALHSNIKQLSFSNINLRDFRGEISLRNQTLRIKQLSTSTEVGNADMNVMYTCTSPNKANATASLIMDSVQIGDLITYLPELDSVMPMLRSFDGSVFCEASASTELDSAFNVVLPTVNAAVLIKGKNLVLLDGETFSEIAKMLMFNKKTRNNIDSVSVELLVRNNEIEIYPFMVSMDKYRLGVGGTQSLNMNFDYHIALLRPLIMGLNVYGTDFDHIKFKLAPARFKDSNVKIGAGGVLIRKDNSNMREILQQTLLNTILKE